MFFEALNLATFSHLNYIMYYYNKQDIETLEILKKHLNYIMYYYN